MEKDAKDDELNKWYHTYLGKCAHRNAKQERGTLSHCSDDDCEHLAWVCWDCETSGYCGGTREELEIIPDYSSDPAETLKILFELMLVGSKAIIDELVTTLGEISSEAKFRWHVWRFYRIAMSGDKKKKEAK